MKDWKLEPARDLGLSLGERTRSLRREGGLIESSLHFLWWLALRLYFRLWHRLEVRGGEHLPLQPPFACVANHSSHLDALALASAMPGRWRDRVFPIAAGDAFFSTPVVAAFAAFILNALPLWRRNCGSHSIEMLRERLVEERAIYVLFPEGTRARDGRLAAFKPGLGMLVAETAIPVVPCYLEGTWQALSPQHKFPRPKKIIAHIGPPLSFLAVKNDRSGWQEIAGAAQAAVESLQLKRS